MRYLSLLTCVLFLMTYNLHAQPHKGSDVYVYGDLSLGGGLPQHFQSTAQCVVFQRYSFGIGYSSFWLRDKNRPSDYTFTGSKNGFWIWEYPNKFLTGTTLTFGYLIYPFRKHTTNFRVHLKAGVLFGNGSSPANYSQPVRIYRGGNYGYDIEEHPTTALLLNSNVEFTPSRAFGVLLGVYAVASNRMTGGGVKVGIMCGKVSDHRIRSAKY